MTEIINAIDDLIDVVEYENKSRLPDDEKICEIRNNLIKLIKDYKIKECSCGRER